MLLRALGVVGVTIVAVFAVSIAMAQDPSPMALPSTIPAHEHKENITRFDALQYVVVFIIATGGSVVGAIVAFFHARWTISNLTTSLKDVAKTLRELVKQGSDNSGRILAVERQLANLEPEFRKVVEKLGLIQTVVEEIEAADASAHRADKSDILVEEILAAVRDELGKAQTARIGEGSKELA